MARSLGRVSMSYEEFLVHHDRAHAPPVVDKLPHAPVGTGYTRKTIGPGVTSLALSPGIDYEIVCDGPLSARCVITGGRNLLGRGWEWDIPLPADTSNRAHTYYVAQCAMEFRNQTGQVFIEGAKVGGAGALDAVRVSGGSAGEYVLQNCRFVSERRQPVTDASDGLFHTDGFQCWTGLRRLSMYQVTIRNAYQALMIGDGALSGLWGPSVYERVNVDGDTSVGQLARLVNFVRQTTYLKGPFTFTDCYYRHARSGWYWGVATKADGTKGAWYSNTLLGTDEKGPWATPDNAKINTLGITGKVRPGLPPGGDYVPAGAAGMGYVSPGYR